MGCDDSHKWLILKNPPPSDSFMFSGTSPNLAMVNAKGINNTQKEKGLKV